MIKDLKINKSQQTNQRWSISNPLKSKVNNQGNYYDNNINYRETTSSNITIDRQEVTAEFASTGCPLDLAISSNGYFQVKLPNGVAAYTRDGMWKIGNDGLLVTSEGYPMSPEIFIPGDALTINISNSGKVTTVLIGCDTQIEIGQIKIVCFENPSGLKSAGRNLWSASKTCGQAKLDIPGNGHHGRIEQGFLELNDVKVIEETVNMMTALRCHQMLSKRNTPIVSQQLSEPVIG